MSNSLQIFDQKIKIKTGLSEESYLMSNKHFKGGRHKGLPGRKGNPPRGRFDVRNGGG